MLNVINHLSMNGIFFEVLQNANAIEILTRILDEQSTGPHSTETSNHIFQTCHDLCRLNKGRQEEAAQAGIIPLLMRVIESSSPLRQFALSIFVRPGERGEELSKRSRVYSGMVKETARVEDELARPKSLDALFKCFVSPKAGSFENLLDPFLKICRHSTSIAIGVAKVQFFRSVTEKLSNSKAVVKLELLRTLRAICDVHSNRAQPVKRYGTHETVAAFWCKDGTVFARDRAEPHTCVQALFQGSRYTQELDRAEETHHAPHGKRYVGNRHPVATAR
ncbi:hypothetical protein H4582DRAFT_2156698 [Lactarius indigo]|nr:hypothetical protein H4582DRAFT_2156698 [Lactarius indigo]